MRDAKQWPLCFFVSSTHTSTVRPVTNANCAESYMRSALDLLVCVPVQLNVTHLLGQSSPSSDGDTLSATIQPPNLSSLSSATVSVRLTSASTFSVVAWADIVSITDMDNAVAVNLTDLRIVTRTSFVCLTLQ